MGSAPDSGFLAKRAKCTLLLGLMDDAQEQELLPEATVEHAKSSRGQLPDGGGETAELFHLAPRDLSLRQPHEIAFDTLARLLRNGKEITFRVLGKNKLKRFWRAAHAQGTRASSPDDPLGHQPWLRQSGVGIVGYTQT